MSQLVGKIKFRNGNTLEDSVIFFLLSYVLINALTNGYLDTVKEIMLIVITCVRAGIVYRDSPLYLAMLTQILFCLKNPDNLKLPKIN